MEKFRLTDESSMPFGKHAGKKMANVPPEYLLWVYDEDRCSAPVRLYIKENLEDLRSDVNY